MLVILNPFTYHPAHPLFSSFNVLSHFILPGFLFFFASMVNSFPFLSALDYIFSSLHLCLILLWIRLLHKFSFCNSFLFPSIILPFRILISHFALILVFFHCLYFFLGVSLSPLPSSPFSLFFIVPSHHFIFPYLFLSPFPIPSSLPVYFFFVPSHCLFLLFPLSFFSSASSEKFLLCISSTYLLGSYFLVKISFNLCSFSNASNSDNVIFLPQSCAEYPRQEDSRKTRYVLCYFHYK